MATEDTLRSTGRTKKAALQLLLKALENPGMKFEVLDHYDTPQAYRALAIMCDNIVSVMGLPQVQIENRANRFFIWFNKEIA